MPIALIVDDDPPVNELLSQVVRIRQYETVSALTGAEALAHVADRVPDVIFLDLMLPDADGFDLCREIAARRTTCLVPIVIVSARLATENRTRGHREGAIGYIAKPYTPHQIFTALEQAAAWRRDLDESPLSGELRLGGVEDELLLGLVRLRALLLARTALDDATVGRIVTTLEQAGRETQELDHARSAGPLLTAEYQIQDDQVRLALRPLPGRPTATAICATIESWVRNAFDAMNLGQPRGAIVVQHS